jgi:hypothetical protein
VTESVLEDMIRKQKLRPHQEINLNNFHQEYKRECKKKDVDALNFFTMSRAIIYWHPDWKLVDTKTEAGHVLKRKCDV